MKKKQHILVFLLLLGFNFLQAQTIEVVSFDELPNDLRARRFIQKDVNENECALIVVRSALRDLMISPNSGRCCPVEYKKGEYWVYVSPGERKISYWSERFTRKDYIFPVSIQSNKVYSLVLESPGVPQQEELHSLTFQFNTENVYVSKSKGAFIKTNGKVATFQLPLGVHEFTFYKQGFEDKTISIDFNGEQIERVNLLQGSTQTKMQLPGFIVVETKPDNASVFLNGQRAGVTPFTKEVLAGTYEVQIVKEMYYSETQTRIVKEGETVVLEDIVLKDKFGFISIDSDHKDAEVFIDGILVGKPPVVNLKLESGTHQIEVRKDMYHSYKEMVLIEDAKNRTVEAMLKPAFGTLNISTEPSEAYLEINGEDYGKTPYTNSMMPSGTYRIKVEKDWHIPVQQTVVVADGKTVEKLIPLSPDYGILEVDVKDGSQIYIDGDYKSKGWYRERLKPGTYLVKVSLENHEDIIQDAHIALGEITSLKLNPDPLKGSVSVSSNPSQSRGAKIFVNGVEHGVTPAILVLNVGTYNICVRHPDFIEEVQQVKVEQNVNSKVKFQLKSYIGSELQDITKYKRKRVFWGVTAAAFLGVGAYYYYSSNKHYEQYQTATSDATALHDKILLEDKIYPVAFAAGGVSLIPVIIFSSKQKQSKKKLNVAVTDAGQVGLQFKF